MAAILLARREELRWRGGATFKQRLSPLAMRICRDLETSGLQTYNTLQKLVKLAIVLRQSSKYPPTTALA